LLTNLLAISDVGQNPNCEGGIDHQNLFGVNAGHLLAANLREVQLVVVHAGADLGHVRHARRLVLDRQVISPGQDGAGRKGRVQLDRNSHAAVGREGVEVVTDYRASRDDVLFTASILNRARGAPEAPLQHLIGDVLQLLGVDEQDGRADLIVIPHALEHSINLID
jgi:hypothetical protein